jgi:hypothetical protein
MKLQWIGAAIGALAGLGLAAAAQASPAGMARTTTVEGTAAPSVLKTGGRHWHHRHRHHRRYYHHHHYRPHYYRPYYGWAPPRRYYRPFYGYYGYRPYYRPGFSIWF